MTVRALVLLKRLEEAKTRLSEALTPPQRRDLALEMAAHVLAVVNDAADETILLTPAPIAAFSHMRQWIDSGRDLNAETTRIAASAAHEPGDILLVIAADLPLLTRADVEQLVEAAKHGVAIAVDRHGTGTNAIGYRQPLDFQFQFGPGSRAAHVRQAGECARPHTIVATRGLSLDIDDPDALRAAGLTADAPAFKPAK